MCIRDSAGIAQLVEQRIENPCVTSSNLVLGKIYYLKAILYNINLVIGFNFLGRKDSNLRMAGPKPAALPLGYAPYMNIIYIII